MDGLFGVGAPELIVIFVVALLVFGPKRLPELGRTVGSLTRRVRNASQEFQREFQQELNRAEDEELLKEEPETRPTPKSLPPTSPPD